jgi:pyruvate/2-oxoglutarate/acetoin dehydrogenase E1 component
MRKLKYVEALNETLHQLMQSDERVVLTGQGSTSPWYTGGTCIGLRDRFGRDRVIDTPVSENGMTGVAIGMALAGLRPIMVHPRLDFMYLALDQIANNAANWHYMFGGQLSVPLTIWGIINRGGEQAAQHAQAIQSMFAHIPGLKVVVPSSPSTVKGLLVSSVRDNNPVVFIDDRWLYDYEGDVKEELYQGQIGKAQILKKGDDITVISSSYLTQVVLEVAHKMSASIEVVDLLSLKPLDKPTIMKSVRKTGRVLIVDGGWKSYGVGAEISASIMEESFEYLKAPVQRLSLPDCPAPASGSLEKEYYIDKSDIISEINFILGWQ